ncbi:MAG: insulinase family protein [Bacteroidetes bacterium]|nr:insulinase family protein [Bacteroidota bacterium]
MLSNWYGKMFIERYPLLYPEQHPYDYLVLGDLEQILGFTAEQCMEFYHEYYGPDNAFMVIVGDITFEEAFENVKKHFGTIERIDHIYHKRDYPFLDDHKLTVTELNINYPVQIYSFVYPRPAFGHKDFTALNLVTDLLFFGDNSILNNILVKKEHLAYGIFRSFDNANMHQNMGTMDVIMRAFPGNIRVKKIIYEEIEKILKYGVSEDQLERYIKATKNEMIFSDYYSDQLAARIGMAEYYYADPEMAYKAVDLIERITNRDIARVTFKYLSPDKLQMINIKPSW